MTFISGQPALVLDASVCVEILRGEPTWSSRLEQWLSVGAMLLAPPMLRFEVANALLRSARLPAGVVIDDLDDLDALALDIADRGLAGLRAAVRLAHLHRLTVYDAAYLDLAIDVDGALATTDAVLRRAAEAEGVAVIG